MWLCDEYEFPWMGISGAELDFSLLGDCDSHAFVLGVEGNQVGCLLVQLQNLHDARHLALMTVTL